MSLSLQTASDLTFVQPAQRAQPNERATFASVFFKEKDQE